LRKIYWVDIGQIVTKIIPINFEANSCQNKSLLLKEEFASPRKYLRKIYWVDIGQIVTKIIPINFEANSCQNKSLLLKEEFASPRKTLKVVVSFGARKYYAPTRLLLYIDK
jgi:hypothetical protein